MRGMIEHTEKYFWNFKGNYFEWLYGIIDKVRGLAEEGKSIQWLHAEENAVEIKYLVKYGVKKDDNK